MKAIILVSILVWISESAISQGATLLSRKFQYYTYITGQTEKDPTVMIEFPYTITLSSSACLATVQNKDSISVYAIEGCGGVNFGGSEYLLVTLRAKEKYVKTLIMDLPNDTAFLIEGWVDGIGKSPDKVFLRNVVHVFSNKKLK